MTRARMSLAAATLAVVMTAVAASPALATAADPPVVDPPIVDETYNGIPGNFTGGDVTDPSVPQPLTPQAVAKQNLTVEYDNVMTLGADNTQLRQMQASYDATYGTSGYLDAGDGLVDGVTATPPASRILSLAQYGQVKGYYCGPASGYMMIRYMHGSSFTSRYNGASLSQANLATSAHMNTNTAGATTWTSGRFALGINRWRGNTFYIQYPKPTGSFLANTFKYNIYNYGMPLAADTVEFAGGVHYNGHPTSRTIGHWIVGYGYANSGGTGYWADPATTVWSGVSAKFTYSNSLFASRFLQSNGIVY